MFSKKPAENPRNPTDKKVSGGTFSIIGADVVIKGDVTASADLHIDGRVEGDIACSSLVQGESSNLSGAIMAESARLAGHVDGSISAGQLVVLSTARIEGDVRYDSLTIEQGAEVAGSFAHRPAGETAAPRGDAAPAAAAPAKPAEDGDGGEPRLSLAG